MALNLDLRKNGRLNYLCEIEDPGAGGEDVKARMAGEFIGMITPVYNLFALQFTDGVEALKRLGMYKQDIKRSCRQVEKICARVEYDTELSTTEMVIPEGGKSLHGLLLDYWDTTAERFERVTGPLVWTFSNYLLKEGVPHDEDVAKLLLASVTSQLLCKRWYDLILFWKHKFNMSLSHSMYNFAGIERQMRGILDRLTPGRVLDVQGDYGCKQGIDIYWRMLCETENYNLAVNTAIELDPDVEKWAEENVR